MASQSQLPFKPLEYWKPPKAVQHIRAKSSSLFTPANKGHRLSFANSLDSGDKHLDKKEMSFATKSADEVQMRGGYGYQLDREDTLSQPWYNFKYWGKRAWAGFIAVVVIIILIIIIVAVEVTKENAYPDYTPLTYSLAETYSGTSFFDNFDYFTGYDPSSGFVHYVPEGQATALNLTYASSSTAVLRVDTSVGPADNPNASTGRFSVRISSKNQYGLNSLFIFDVVHSPLGCGTWPALWLTDPSNWPYHGEIDVMEAVNVISTSPNQMTLHTTSGCSMDVKRKETGKSLSTSCVNTTNDNAGCGVDAGSTTFGADFNSAGGAVLAMELRSAGIRMWQFGRSSIPSDITSGAPDPSTWGEATADFPSTDCNIGNHFQNQSIIANIDLCGTWAGATSVFSENCPGSCTDYVANNNGSFADAYWEFGAFKVYSAS